jgi:uncharacterized surface protein with fasciclin (FAS1) repeats
MQETILKKNIVETALADGSFKVLIRALRGTGIIDTLNNAGISYTLFAPNDKAFKKLSPDGTLENLLKDKALLVRVINSHILPYKMVLAHVDDRKVARSRAGQNLLIDTTGGLRVGINAAGSDRIGGAAVLRADIECANGILHEIDTVLMPPR